LKGSLERIGGERLEPVFRLSVIGPENLFEYRAMPQEPFSTMLLDPANPPQVKYWAEQFQVEPSQMTAAIPFAGRRLTNIRRYLGRTADILYLDDWRADKRGKQRRSFHPVA
jgi:hypothetical protein